MNGPHETLVSFIPFYILENTAILAAYRTGPRKWICLRQCPHPKLYFRPVGPGAEQWQIIPRTLSGGHKGATCCSLQHSIQIFRVDLVFLGCIRTCLRRGSAVI